MDFEGSGGLVIPSFVYRGYTTSIKAKLAPALGSGSRPFWASLSRLASLFFFEINGWNRPDRIDRTAALRGILMVAHKCAICILLHIEVQLD
jgi:hypothetical protein